MANTLTTAYEANIVAGKPPYEGAKIATSGELICSWRSVTGRGNTNSPDGYDRADFARCEPQFADVSGVDLRGVNLRDANLRGANLSGVYLRDADMRGADLRVPR